MSIAIFSSLACSLLPINHFQPPSSYVSRIEADELPRTFLVLRLCRRRPGQPGQDILQRTVHDAVGRAFMPLTVILVNVGRLADVRIRRQREGDQSRMRRDAGEVRESVASTQIAEPQIHGLIQGRQGHGRHGSPRPVVRHRVSVQAHGVVGLVYQARRVCVLFPRRHVGFAELGFASGRPDGGIV